MEVTGLSVSSRTYPSAGQSKATLILAHGAGAGQLHPFMTGYANALAALGLDVVTFNFPYMDAKRRMPDAAAMLESCYRTVIGAVLRDVASAGRALFIGGKSMGGRIATQLAAADASLPVNGLVFVQGSRDTFGTPAELQPALDSMSPTPTLLVVEGGDHSFKVSGGAGQQTVSAARVQQTIAEWIGRVAI